jgi:hypothetical protein
MTAFIGLFNTVGDYTLQFTITHKLMSTLTSSVTLLGSGWPSSRYVPGLSYELLTATD